MTSQWHHHNKIHTKYSELNCLQNIFWNFQVLKINTMMPFCNLFMERPLYLITPIKRFAGKVVSKMTCSVLSGMLHSSTPCICMRLVADTAWRLACNCKITVYTVSQKKLDPFPFEHNFCKYCPILIILSLLQTEKLYAHKHVMEFATSPSICCCITLKHATTYTSL